MDSGYIAIVVAIALAFMPKAFKEEIGRAIGRGVVAHIFKAWFIFVFAFCGYLCWTLLSKVTDPSAVTREEVINFVGGNVTAAIYGVLILIDQKTKQIKELYQRIQKLETRLNAPPEGK